MSRNILFATVAILFLFLISACSKKDPVTGEVKTNYLKVKIDGREKSFSDVKARWVEGGNFLEINATDDGSEWITITVMSEKTRVPAGQYHLEDASEFNILSTYSLINTNGQLNYAATRGTLAPEDAFSIKIDKIDNGSTEGSFAGVLVRVEGINTLGSVALSDGQFKTVIKPN